MMALVVGGMGGVQPQHQGSEQPAAASALLSEPLRVVGEGLQTFGKKRLDGARTSKEQHSLAP